MTTYHIIGDIHGQADKLEGLLHLLGYRKRRDGFHAPQPGAGQEPCRVLFLGDFIDRGPDNRRVLGIVRAMIARGDALAVMGNHEYNAICYHTRHPRTGEPLRRHSPKNQRQHQSFLDEFPLDAPGTREVIDWFRTLPLFLERPVESAVAGVPGHLRAIHACWHEPLIAAVRARLGHEPRLDEDFLIESVEKDSPAYNAIENLLKGPSMRLPEGSTFRDKDGHERHEVRINWWSGGQTFRELAVVDEADRAGLPAIAPDGPRPWIYPEDAPPVFFGHYWMTGEPRTQGPNCACLDYSAGKGGPLMSYRWSPQPGGLRGDAFRYEHETLDSRAWCPLEPPDGALSLLGDAEQLRHSEECGCIDCLSVYPVAELDLLQDSPRCSRCGGERLLGSASGLSLTRMMLAEFRGWCESVAVAPCPEPES